MQEKKSKKGRREFIKSGIAGLAGAAVAPNLLGAAENDNKEKAKKEGKKIFRTLGRTGIRLPIVSMGAQASDPAIYSAALEAGVVHFDTANSYNRGGHEKMLAKVLKGKPRDSFVVGTKVHMPVDHKTGQFITPGNVELFRRRFEESMKRLEMDYVDILYIHDVLKAEAAGFEPYLNELVKIKKSGRAKFIGLSVHTREPEVIRAAADTGVYDVVLTSYNFRQPHWKEVKAAIAHAAGKGLGIVAMKTQAGVFWDRERQKPINMKAALKWVLNDPNVHTAIPGFSNFAEMETDLSVMEDLALTARERADLHLDKTAGITGLYCDQCGQCRNQCDRVQAIPDLMRAYMYAYGYRNLSKARETVGDLDPSSLACHDCNTCKVDCSMGFDLKEKIQDIARLATVPGEFLV